MWEQRHFETIFPEAYVDARVSMYSVETENDLLSGDPDYVLDAIDNIETKVSWVLKPECLDEREVVTLKIWQKKSVVHRVGA
jgi:tRNA A37 threonylcarbamoyladenosine dehydratase